MSGAREKRSERATHLLKVRRLLHEVKDLVREVRIGEGERLQSRA